MVVVEVPGGEKIATNIFLDKSEMISSFPDAQQFPNHAKQSFSKKHGPKRSKRDITYRTTRAERLAKA